MIKIFRTIRQGFIQNGKIRSYVPYAIGEVFLVVLGIFIALQLNIWNEDRKNQKESKEFISRLLDESRANLNFAKAEILVEENQIRASKGILDMFNEKIESINPGHLDSLVFIIFSTNTLKVNMGTFSEGLNTGKIALIKSDSLRLALYNLPTLIEEVRQNESIDDQDINGGMDEFLYDHFNLRKMDNAYSEYKGKLGNSKFSNFDNLKLLNIMKFESIVDNRYYSNLTQLNELRKMLNVFQDIERMILKS